MTDSSILIESEDYVRGDRSSEIQLIEYGDFECDYCRSAYPIISQILSEHPHEIAFSFRHFPLTSLHGQAQRAAEISESAGQRGKFWEIFDYFFTHKLDLSRDALHPVLTSLNLPADEIFKELDQEIHHLKVRTDFRSGVKAGVNGTPTLFVNGVQYMGELTYGALSLAIRGKYETVSISKRSPKSADTSSPEERIEALSRLRGREVTAEDIQELFTIIESADRNETFLQASLLFADWFLLIVSIETSLVERFHEVVRTHPWAKNTLLLSKYYQEEHFPFIPWEGVEDVVQTTATFYDKGGLGLSTRESNRRVASVIKSASQAFIKEGRFEEAFSIFFQLAPAIDQMDSDLYTIRNALSLYERKRALKVQRALVFTLIAVISSVIFIMPTLFLMAENPFRVSQGLGEIPFGGALYWSFITFATVGYGDIVPLTSAGKGLALILGISGVLTGGIIAGLILGAVTQRRL